MIKRCIHPMILAVAVLATSMTFIDATALNQALPSISHWFSATAFQSLLIVGAYNVLLAISLFPAGVIADRLGRVKVLVSGILVFVIASILCAAATDVNLLIVGRGVQGIGGALMITGSLALLTASSEPGHRGRTIGAWSSWCAAATVIGPLVGGALAEAGWWQAIFWINVPLAAITILLLALIDRKVKVARDEQRLTVPESKSIWRSSTLRGSLGLTVLLDTAFYGILLVVPLALIEGAGYRADQAAAAQLPVVLMLIVACPIAGRWHDRKGPRSTVCCGALVAMLGLIWIAVFGMGTGPDNYVKQLLGPFMMIGAGLGFGIVGLSTTVMNEVGEPSLGAGAAANALVARMAAALSVGAFGLVLLWHDLDLQGLNAESADWKMSLRISMWLAAGLCATVLLGGVKIFGTSVSARQVDQALLSGGDMPR